MALRSRNEDEIYGVIVEMLGASRLRVRCEDGKIRICRIPGKLKKRVWMREGDVVILKPWIVQSDERGDIVWRFTATEASQLRRRGELKVLEG